MSKPKFKVGDKVKVKSNRDVRDLTHFGFPEGIIKQIGEVVDLTPFYDLVIVRFQNSVAKLRVPVHSLKLVKPEKIIIYRNGAEVVAKNTATGKTGVAKCNPADKFDFNTGVKLAFERLTNPEPEKPKYYTGKVVCVSAFSNCLTKGKVYEIKDGVGKDDAGTQITHKPVKSFKEFNQKMVSEFIELVE